MVKSPCMMCAHSFLESLHAQQWLLVRYCHVTNNPNIRCLKPMINVHYLIVSVDQEFETAQLGGLGRSPLVVVISCQQGLLSSDVLTETGASASDMAPSWDLQVAAGCWGEDSFPANVALCVLIGCLSVLTKWCLCSPRTSHLRENKVELTIPCMTQPRKSHIITTIMFFPPSFMRYN